jgi:hypothetical protein
MRGARGGSNTGARRPSPSTARPNVPTTYGVPPTRDAPPIPAQANNNNNGAVALPPIPPRFRKMPPMQVGDGGATGPAVVPGGVRSQQVRRLPPPAPASTTLQVPSNASLSSSGGASVDEDQEQLSPTRPATRSTTQSIVNTDANLGSIRLKIAYMVRLCYCLLLLLAYWCVTDTRTRTQLSTGGSHAAFGLLR